MIDSHTHLDHLDDPDAAVAAALAAGVGGMISIGCGADSIVATLEIARRHESCVRVGAGVHPQAAAAFDADAEWDAIVDLCRDPLVVGIGETGFDQYRDHGTLAQQQPAFELQCALARELGKPLIIHTRAADEHTLTALAEHAADLDVILHCFSLVEHVDAVIERGYTCSFAGNVTYRSAQDLRDALALLPPDRIMVETDAPYLAPVPHRGRRNEPAFTAGTLVVVAEVMGVVVAEADRITTANARRIFSLDAAFGELPTSIGA